MPRKIDLTGQTFGRLLVIGEVGKNKAGHYMWNCKCECGKSKVVNSYHLRSGAIKSCGCLRVDRNVAFNKATKVTHGKRYTRLYNIWRGIKYRTKTKTSSKYAEYGERGITICQAWEDDFQSFYDWAMANGYADDLTLDRKDNDGPYSPENCRWATAKVQGNNRRSNTSITHNGKTLTLAQWADELGIPRARIYKRAEANLPVEEILYPGKLPSHRRR